MKEETSIRKAVNKKPVKPLSNVEKPKDEIIMKEETSTRKAVNKNLVKPRKNKPTIQKKMPKPIGSKKTNKKVVKDSPTESLYKLLKQRSKKIPILNFDDEFDGSGDLNLN